MNGKRAITGVVIGAVAFGAALQYGRAASQTPAPSQKIGLVSIRDVFNGSKKYGQYQAQRTKRRSEASAKLEELAKELANREGDLKAIVPGTADYLKQFQIVVEQRSKLQAQQEFLKQQQMMEDKEWLEGLYQEALKVTETIAKERGLDLVLERTEPKFPMTASEEVLSVISTHKVLYCGACVDLTSEVLTRVDASTGIKP